MHPAGTVLPGLVLKVEAELGCVRSRRNEVRPAERRQEVVKRRFVRYIDGRQAQTPLVATLVDMEEVIIAYAYVKEIARLNTRWMVVHIERCTREVDQP